MARQYALIKLPLETVRRLKRRQNQLGKPSLNDLLIEMIGILDDRNPVGFSEIAPLNENPRMDRAWRFITLIFMQSDQEVEIEQVENDLLIQRRYHEAHC